MSSNTMEIAYVDYLTKTIAISGEVYEKLKELERPNSSYGKLIERLVEIYKRSRPEALHEVVERSSHSAKRSRRRGRPSKGWGRSWWTRS